MIERLATVSPIANGIPNSISPPARMRRGRSEGGRMSPSGGWPSRFRSTVRVGETNHRCAHNGACLGVAGARKE